VTAKIEIQKVVEHDDGSATVIFDCDEEARDALISIGLISLIEKAVTEHKEEEEEKENEKSGTQD
jgi:hypothetical protein